MSREEIGEIKDSIKHWQRDILKPLQKGRKTMYKKGGYFLRWKDTLQVVPVYGDYCPLCEYTKECCSICPLAIKDLGCNDAGSPWRKFINRHTVQNAQKMIDALKSLLK